MNLPSARFCVASVFVSLGCGCRSGTAGSAAEMHVQQGVLHFYLAMPGPAHACVLRQAGGGQPMACPIGFLPWDWHLLRKKQMPGKVSVAPVACLQPCALSCDRCVCLPRLWDETPA